MELSRRISTVVPAQHQGGVGSWGSPGAISHDNNNPSISPISISPISPITLNPYSQSPPVHDSTIQPRPHVYHLFQTLLTPTPRLLTALAERRHAAEAARQLEASSARSHERSIRPILDERDPHQVDPLPMSQSGIISHTQQRAGAELGIIDETTAVADGTWETPPPYEGNGKVPAYQGMSLSR